ncbi:phosphoadenylyl-sulfate reductase [Ramlibacter sp. RBP-2]|uniref:Adenosine 5'-phosphosulfate reductase n=1 Tax=Ramlibacter lithotrophicus TaxID=2606681 RepID=A0A7X6DCT3_9BURK|nr:phosphoadenylyl-sulfate reductase [Ramlibacter lithotrophicus]
MGAVELNARPSPDFAAKLLETSTLLRRAASEFAPVTQASSLGAEDVVITHMINVQQLHVPVFVLDTGMLHPQTLELLERTRAASRAPVTVYRPAQEAVVQFVAREGGDAMYRSIELRKACCGIRKMEPLARALEGQRAWITGLRREQSGARAEVPLLDASDATRVKFNPLARWTWGDVWHYIALHGVDYNPLHDQFYPSIGCAPCTRAIAAGEDFRAGRWWWESSDTTKECGLHVKPQAGASSPVAASAQANFAEGEVKASQEAGRSQEEQAKECGLHVKKDEVTA